MLSNCFDDFFENEDTPYIQVNSLLQMDMIEDENFLDVCFSFIFID